MRHKNPACKGRGISSVRLTYPAAHVKGPRLINRKWTPADEGVGQHNAASCNFLPLLIIAGLRELPPAPTHFAEVFIGQAASAFAEAMASKSADRSPVRGKMSTRRRVGAKSLHAGKAFQSRRAPSFVKAHFRARWAVYNDSESLIFSRYAAAV